MPDLDRFERTLRGRHWLKAYRLSFSDENREALRDTLMKACAAYMRDVFPTDCLKNCPRIVFESLRKKSSTQEGSDGNGIFIDLNRQLSHWDSEERDFAATEIMKTAAQAVFTDLETRCKSVTSLDVEQSFSRELIERVIRHRFLARARDGIAFHRSQSASQQFDWENDLVALKRICAELVATRNLIELYIQRSVLSLYSRYTEEWEKFPARKLLVRPRAA